MRSSRTFLRDQVPAGTSRPVTTSRFGSRTFDAPALATAMYFGGSTVAPQDPPRCRLLAEGPLNVAVAKNPSSTVARLWGRCPHCVASSARAMSVGSPASKGASLAVRMLPWRASNHRSLPPCFDTSSGGATGVASPHRTVQRPAESHHVVEESTTIAGVMVAIEETTRADLDAQHGVDATRVGADHRRDQRHPHPPTSPRTTSRRASTVAQ